jgi:hypothetical protein
MDLAYTGINTGNAVDYLLVTGASTGYEQPPSLPLFISNEQCSVFP